MAESSWVPGADGSGFGVEHLPYGVVRRPGAPHRVAVRIGESALELAPLADDGLLDPVGVDGAALSEALLRPSLNGLLALGPRIWTGIRRRLQELLGVGNSELRDAGAEQALVPLTELELQLPIEAGDYVDFYSSLEHASNVGRLFRPEGDPLMPNWRHLPVGYHGRAGTVVISGTPVRRPLGQGPPEGPGAAPSFGPERLLDFELELGFVTGPGPAPGEAIPAAEAEGRIFGFCLLNDWSARGIQLWESQPLGPFLGKSFATSIATWITPLGALAPFRVPGPDQDPPPLDYLRVDEPRALDLELEVALRPPDAAEETVITRVNASRLYWGAAQQLAHATVNGAAIRAGDLFGSGTISGWDAGSHGCLLEATRAGQQPLRLADGGERGFLEDGDEVVLRGSGAPGEDRPKLTLAEVRGRVEPAF